MDPAHRSLCGYRIVRPLAEHSFLAADERGQSIVIKRLNDSCLLQGRLHPAIGNRLQHVRGIPLMSLANLHGVEQDAGTSYLIWQYVEGRTLAAIFKNHESNESASNAVRESRRAIQKLHDAGVVHGAIHERNIVIDEKGGAHLTHVSPLLFHDTEVDHAAFKEMMQRFPEFDAEDAIFAPLMNEDRAGRFYLLGGAIGFAIIGILIAVLVVSVMR